LQRSIECLAEHDGQPKWFGGLSDVGNDTLRYLFRGLIRETGKPVVGHVEADTEETAFNALADNGIVTESISPDPKPSFPAPPVPGGGGGTQSQARYADALDSAFDTSAHQIAFDDLTERYRGKRVWVIDRDKIRKRVAQVVDEAMTSAQADLDTDTETRERVAKAIEGLFKDAKNITSPQQLPATPPPVAPMPMGRQLTGAAAVGGLDAQVDRLAMLITTAENVLATIQNVARNASFGGGGGAGGGGGGGGRRRGRASKVNMVQNDVLLEIFKSNMSLQRGVAIPGPAVGAPAPTSATESDAGEAAAEVAEASGGEEVTADEAESSRPTSPTT